MERKALKLELEELAMRFSEGWHEGIKIDALDIVLLNEAAEALAQPAQEPVAWMVYTLDGASVCVTDNPADFTPEHRALPLYTIPPQRKPLTQDGTMEIANQTAGQYWMDEAHIQRFRAAVEAAHGIKE